MPEKPLSISQGRIVSDLNGASYSVQCAIQESTAFPLLPVLCPLPYRRGGTPSLLTPSELSCVRPSPTVHRAACSVHFSLCYILCAMFSALCRGGACSSRIEYQVHSIQLSVERHVPPIWHPASVLHRIPYTIYRLLSTVSRRGGFHIRPNLFRRNFPAFNYSFPPYTCSPGLSFLNSGKSINSFIRLSRLESRLFR